VRRGGKSVLTTISGDMAKAADYLSQSGMGKSNGKSKPGKIDQILYG